MPSRHLPPDSHDLSDESQRHPRRLRRPPPPIDDDDWDMLDDEDAVDERDDEP